MAKAQVLEANGITHVGPPAQKSDFSLVIATAKLKSSSPLSWSRHHEVAKKDNEENVAHEWRTWMYRWNYNPQTGHIYIPPMAFKRSLEGVASLLNEKIKGKNRQTYAKQFVSGVMVQTGIELPYTMEDVVAKKWCEELFLPSDGKKGSGSRVTKVMPYVPEWEGEITLYVTSSEITEQVFVRYLRRAGMMIGVGRWRAEKGGCYGRFDVVSHTWNPQEME